ncbi:MAG TPA: HlyD family secretion protein [Patescibacteria group bacterium]|nr:HlyD family secretion protein [Patescibacteria group bacterium]
MDSDRHDAPVTSAPDDRSQPPAGEAHMPGRRLPSAPPPAPKSRARLVAFLVIFVLIVAGTGMWLYFRQYESTDDAQIDGHIHPISSRIAGYVIKVNVDDNQYVHAGDVLVEIDPTDFKVAVQKAEAELADAQANANGQAINVPVTSITTASLIRSSEADVQSAKAGIQAADKQVDVMRANLAQTEANDVKLQDDLKRYAQLVQKQEVSEQQYDQALAAAHASSASIAGARAALTAAEQQASQARERLKQAEAGLTSARTGPRQVAITETRAHSGAALVEQKRAELDQAKLNLSYCKILAPSDGIVNKNVEVGQYVQPGQQLLSVVPRDEIYVTANFKETQLHYMKVGQPAVFTVDANGRSYRGHVDSIAGASGARFSLLPPENATGNYVKVVQRIPVKIVLDPGENKDHQLRIGMSVDPRVTVR